MASLNKVLLMGNLTRDPELRYTPSGRAVCNFTLAVNTYFTDKASGQRKEDTCFIRVVVWGKSGENCASYLSKGRAAFVEGRLQSRSWEGEGGQKRTSIEVMSDNVQFLGSRGGKEAGPDSQGPARYVDEEPPPAEDDVPF